MYNNTLTLSKKYDIATSFGVVNSEILVKNEVLRISDFVNAFGYLSSLEFRKSKIKDSLFPIYDFINESFVLDFLANNQDLNNILPSFASYIFNNLDRHAKLSLELLYEGEDWQTLFINIECNTTWKETNEFADKFFDILFELYPGIADKINLDLIPNEL